MEWISLKNGVTNVNTRYSYKATLVINGITKYVYRDTLAGVYEGSNKVIEKCGYPGVNIEVFKRIGSKDWQQIDKGWIEPGRTIRC